MLWRSDRVGTEGGAVVIVHLFLTEMSRLLIAAVLLFVGFGAFALIVYALRVAKAALRRGWRAVGRVPA